MTGPAAGAGAGLGSAGRLARFPCGRVTKWLVVVFWLIAVVAAVPLAGKIGDVQENDAVNWLPSSAESTQVAKISQGFANPNEAPAIVLYERPGGITDADRELARSHVARFEALEGVEDPVVGPVDSPDGAAMQMVVPVDLGESGDGWEKLPDFVEAVMAADVPGDGLIMYVTGPAGFNADFAAAFEGTEGNVLLAAAGVVLLILLITYRSPWLWLLPMISAGVALGVAMGLVYLLADGGAITLTAQTQVILGILVFGAGTDYALLLVARYREELRRHDDRHEAMAFALHRAGPAVFASGVTVVLGMLCLAFAEMNSTASMGPVLAIGIAVGLLVMMTLLPALLVIGGRWLFWPVHPSFGSTDPTESGLWARVGRFIVPRPRKVWIGTTLVLAACAFGVTQISADGLSYEESFINTQDSVVGQRALNEHFPSGTGDPLVVMAPAEAAEQVAGVLRQTPGVEPDSVVLAPPQGGLAYLEATLTDAPDGPAAKDTVERVRDAVHDVAGEDAITGGTTAVLLDTQTASSRDNKVVIPITLAVVFLILVLLLRALLAPVLLLATVVLSFAAAFGISAVVFTHVLGYAGADAGLPLFSFVFLVALGIDYNIFLMTRVQEESRRLGTRAGAVVGLTATGAVITSAGLVLAGTFAVMTAVPMVFLIEIGFVVALGVLLDTLIVRSVLVTALNLDVGRHIWWPSALSRAEQPPAAGAHGPPVVLTKPAPGLLAPAAGEPAMAGAPMRAAAAERSVAPLAAPAAPAPPAPPANGSNGGGRRMEDMSAHENLLAGPPPTRLPELVEAKAMLDAGSDPATVAAQYPDHSAAWAALADAAYANGRTVESYAYARTGYHRGLDALRRSGWKGHGPVPWEHEANRGFLRSLHALGRAAAAIDEAAEAERCFSFLRESSPAAADALVTPRV